LFLHERHLLPQRIGGSFLEQAASLAETDALGRGLDDGAYIIIGQPRCRVGHAQSHATGTEAAFLARSTDRVGAIRQSETKGAVLSGDRTIVDELFVTADTGKQRRPGDWFASDVDDATLDDVVVQ